MKEKGVITVYTDGSCHTKRKLGTWVSIVLLGENKIVLNGVENNTSHNRMELLAVIKSLHYLQELLLVGGPVRICSDSQYVVQLPKRLPKLRANNFRTKAGKMLQNADLVQDFEKAIACYSIEFVKIKAHQKDGDLLNSEADSRVRNLLRKQLKQNEI